jgi:catechol 2,3-dioxygenase-like lactoylglutathione lyase family enzyme
MPAPLVIHSINPVGRLTQRLEESRRFYRDVLGFREIRRPNFNFPGAWLFGYGVQIHPQPGGPIETRVNHLALQVDDLEAAEAALREHGLAYRVNMVADTGVKQIFFHDPDGHTVEIANYPPTPAFV